MALRMQDGLEVVVGDFDFGVAVIRRRLNTHRLPMEWETKLRGREFTKILQFEDLVRNRAILLRFMTIQQVRDWLAVEEDESVIPQNCIDTSLFR